jgi:hypothetical protein
LIEKSSNIPAPNVAKRKEFALAGVPILTDVSAETHAVIGFA